MYSVRYCEDFCPADGASSGDFIQSCFNSAAMQGPLQFPLYKMQKRLTRITIKMNVKVLNKMFDLGAIYGTCKLKIVLSSSGFIS